MQLPSFIFPLLRMFHLPPRLHWHMARLVNTHFLLGIAGYITDDQNRILLFHHTYRRSHPWGMPGGWMQGGESPPAALIREVHEESGLTVQAERLLLVGTTPDRPKLEFIVAARVVSGTFRPSREVDQIGWFALDDLPPLARFHHTILHQLAISADQHGPGWYDAPWIVGHVPL